MTGLQNAIHSALIYMQTTMELLGQALEKDHAAAWAERLNITRQTFSNAKRVGRLSSALAGNIAIELGADPGHWVAIAAIEAEKIALC